MRVIIEIRRKWRITLNFGWIDMFFKGKRNRER